MMRPLPNNSNPPHHDRKDDGGSKRVDALAQVSRARGILRQLPARLGLGAIVQMVQWSASLMALRWIGPEEYALWLVWQLVASLAWIVGENGWGIHLFSPKHMRSSITLKEPSGIQHAQIRLTPRNAALWLVGLLIMLLAWIFRHAGGKDVAAVGMMLLVGLLAPRLIVTRHRWLWHGRILGWSLMEAASKLASSACLAAMAWWGWGAWSLAIGYSAGFGAMWALSYMFDPNLGAAFGNGPSAAPSDVTRTDATSTRTDATGTRRQQAGWHNVAWWMIHHADLCMGWLSMPAHFLGQYRLALHMGSLGVQKLSPHAQSVILPALAWGTSVPRKLATLRVVAVPGLGMSLLYLIGISSAARSGWLGYVMGPHWSGLSSGIVILATAMVPYTLYAWLLPFAQSMGYADSFDWQDGLFASFMMAGLALAAASYSDPHVFLIQVASLYAIGFLIYAMHVAWWCHVQARREGFNNLSACLAWMAAPALCASFACIAFHFALEQSSFILTQPSWAGQDATMESGHVWLVEGTNISLFVMVYLCFRFSRRQVKSWLFQNICGRTIHRMGAAIFMRRPYVQ